MNPNKQQTAAIGAFLIALGLVMWLNLWWLIAPGALVAGGVVGYRQRQRLGRPAEAVQVLLWCFGLALVFLTGFWLGVLFLAGSSLLLRGRELQANTMIQQAISQARTRRSASRSIATQQVPISAAPAAPTSEYEAPSTGNTTRLGQ
jgi:hypothetical protein